PWNIALEDLFLERFKEDYPEHSRDETYVRNHFRQRLETIRAAIRIQVRQKDRPDLQEESAAHSRRTERRRAVYSIIQSNGHDTMKLLLAMVELLGTDGMSSDESASDVGQPCTVVGKNWRNPDLIRLLKWIDLHRPRQVEAGERKPGNQPHRRLRLPYGKTPKSLRRAIANLPINFYDKLWYQGLSPGQR
ncbi:hypothetical protein C8R46DRAFT_812069, partial [Mycena filopes]